MSGCGNRSCDDIFTLHAALNHAATEIQFALNYLNGTDQANITDIDKHNVQQILERYFSIWGIPIQHEIPDGLKDKINLHYRTEFEFIPGSLQVILSGVELNGNQSDPERDFTVDGDNKGFTLVLAPNAAHRLNSPPRQYEPLHVNYLKRITFNTKGGS